MRAFKAVLPLLTIAFVAFIWLHSAMSAEASSAESGFLLEFLNNIPIFGNITEYALRKTAHFAEYAVLGGLVWLDLLLYSRNRIIYCLSGLYFCLSVAVIDELIQLFSLGRSSMVMDIVIDHCGSIFGMCFVAMAIALFKKRKVNY